MGGGGGYIHIFVFCPTNLFWNELKNKEIQKKFVGQNTNIWIYTPLPPINALVTPLVTFHDCLFIAWENPTINSHTLQPRRSLIWSRFSDQNVPWLSFYCFTIALSSMRSSESIRMFYCLLIVYTVLYEMQSRSSQEA